jgi:hypothetical protein
MQDKDSDVTDSSDSVGYFSQLDDFDISVDNVDSDLN